MKSGYKLFPNPSTALLIVPEGIEIKTRAVSWCPIALLIVPEGIEILNKSKEEFCRLDLLIVPEGIEILFPTK